MSVKGWCTNMSRDSKILAFWLYTMLWVIALITLFLVMDTKTVQLEGEVDKYREENIYMTDRIFSLNWELQRMIAEDDK